MVMIKFDFSLLNDDRRRKESSDEDGDVKTQRYKRWKMNARAR